MNFDSLPVEIKYRIFSFLYNFELKTIAPVSKQWNSMVKDPFFRYFLRIDDESSAQIIMLIEKYKRIRWLMFRSRSNIESLVPILPDIAHVRKLDFLNCHFNSTGTLLKLLQRVPCLHEFTISICKFDEFNCLNLIENCKLLKRLAIGDQCPYNHGHTCADIFLKNSKNIEQLILFCECVSDELFQTVIGNLRTSLKKLRVGAKHLTENSYPLLRNCHQMTELNLSDADQLKDDGLIAIRELHYLQSLSISSSKAYFCRFFYGISLYNLKYLMLSGSSNLPNLTIELIADSCLALHSLILSRSTNNLDSGLCAVVKRCKYLQELILFSLSSTTGKFLKEIPTHLPNLKRLNVFNCELISHSEIPQLKAQ